MTLRDKLIDTSKITDSDKLITNITGDTLSVQVDGTATVLFKGSHANFPSDEFYPIALINMTTLEKVTTTSGPGLYVGIIEGMDEITLDISGNGKIHWKEIG